MKEKKVSADWYIAATHWLTSSVAMAILGALIGFVLLLIFQNPIILALGFIVIYPLCMWFAVKYSVKYLGNTYLIKNANQIVILSTIYLIIVGGGLRLLDFKGVVTYENIGFVLAVFVFYFSSKKYLKNDTEAVLS